MFRSNQTNKKLYSTNPKSIQLLGTVRIKVNTAAKTNVQLRCLKRSTHYCSARIIRECLDNYKYHGRLSAFAPDRTLTGKLSHIRT